MTLEEAKALAEQGNVAAAMAVGQELIRQDKFREATKYVEIAAEGGSSSVSNEAMLLSMDLRHLLMTVNLDMSDYVDAVECADKLSEYACWCLNIRETSSADMFGQEDYDKAYRYALDALFYGAVACYMLERFQQGLEATRGLESPKIRMMHAMCLFQTAENEQEMQQAFEDARIVETRDFYSEDQFTDSYDRWAVFHTAKILAFFYREGITGRPEVGRAYEVMKNIYNLIDDEKFREKVREEMNRYKFSAFGGYQYQ